MMNVNLSLDERQDCWFSISSSRVSWSEAVAARMAWPSCQLCLDRAGNRESDAQATYRVLHPAVVFGNMAVLVWDEEAFSAADSWSDVG